MGPIKAISSALQAFFTFFMMVDQFVQAGEKVARYTNDSAEHFTNKAKLERYAEIRSVREQLRIAEGEVI